jgi:hypothetical protein
MKLYSLLDMVGAINILKLLKFLMPAGIPDWQPLPRTSLPSHSVVVYKCQYQVT